MVNVPIEFCYRILLSFGADVDLKDHKNYTPLFYASSSGSLANLFEFLDRGRADVSHVSCKNQYTALTKAKSHEVIRILLQHGAEVTWFKMKTFLQYDTEISTRAILSKSVDTKNDGDFLILDFGLLKSKGEKEQCDLALHRIVNEQKEEKQKLLLHPVLQSFLELKWSQIRKHYIFHFCLNTILAIFLSWTGYYFLSLIYCMTCDESAREHHDCTMPIVDPKGLIQCFGLKSWNETLDEYKKDVVWDENCKKGGERCALMSFTNGTKLMRNLTEFNNSLRCHKNFLR